MCEKYMSQEKKQMANKHIKYVNLNINRKSLIKTKKWLELFINHIRKH